MVAPSRWVLLGEAEPGGLRAEDAMPSCSFALLAALQYSLSCVKILRGLPAPHWAASLALTIIMPDLSQALTAGAD